MAPRNKSPRQQGERLWKSHDREFWKVVSIQRTNNRKPEIYAFNLPSVDAAIHWISCNLPNSSPEHVGILPQAQRYPDWKPVEVLQGV